MQLRYRDFVEVVLDLLHEGFDLHQLLLLLLELLGLRQLQLFVYQQQVDFVLRQVVGLLLLLLDLGLGADVLLLLAHFVLLVSQQFVLVVELLLLVRHGFFDFVDPLLASTIELVVVPLQLVDFLLQLLQLLFLRQQLVEAKLEIPIFPFEGFAMVVLVLAQVADAMLVQLEVRAQRADGAGAVAAVVPPADLGEVILADFAKVLLLPLGFVLDLEVVIVGR